MFEVNLLKTNGGWRIDLRELSCDVCHAICLHFQLLSYYFNTTYRMSLVMLERTDLSILRFSHSSPGNVFY